MKKKYLIKRSAAQRIGVCGKRSKACLGKGKIIKKIGNRKSPCYLLIMRVRLKEEDGAKNALDAFLRTDAKDYGISEYEENNLYPSNAAGLLRIFFHGFSYHRLTYKKTDGWHAFRCLVAKDVYPDMEEALKRMWKSICPYLEETSFCKGLLLWNGAVRQADAVNYAVSEKNAYTQEEIDAFIESCYHAYQLDWMISHGYCLGNFLAVLIQNIQEQVESGDCEDPVECFSIAVASFLSERGFNGSLFACKEEFRASEFQDESYMGHLIWMMPEPEKKMELWRNIMKKGR